MVMKGLSIEQKAKAYDKALGKAEDALNDGTISNNTIAYLQDIFPELKESKDEKMRKGIIRTLKRYANCVEEGDDAPSAKNFVVKEIEKQIAWLENLNLIKANSPQLGEQKTTDKVESKFHEGDWVILTAGELSTTLQIVSVDINKKLYWFNDSSYLPIVDEECLHHWTIQDAKDGDVLFHSDSASNGIFIFKEIIDKGFAKEVICYCDYDSEDHFCLGEHHTCCLTDAKILYPATKEQRDTLKRAMTNAGWEFDFEKKELKKIEESENIKEISFNSEKASEEYIAWLKSLKQRIGG